MLIGEIMSAKQFQQVFLIFTKRSLNFNISIMNYVKCASSQSFFLASGPNLMKSVVVFEPLTRSRTTTLCAGSRDSTISLRSSTTFFFFFFCIFLFKPR